jgi:hypothetical protein
VVWNLLLQAGSEGPTLIGKAVTRYLALWAFCARGAQSRANRTLLSSVWAAAAVPASVLTAARKLNIRGSCGVSEDLQIELRKTFSMSDLEGLRGYNLRHHGIGRSNASGTL